MTRSLLHCTLLALLVSLLLPVRSEAAPLPPSEFCTLADTSNVWQGLGVGPGTTDEWESDSNWSTGLSPLAGDEDVCIPEGGVPRIRAGEEAHLRTLDIAAGGHLTVDEGGKLFLYGDQGEDQDSVVRPGGRLDVVGATLGGIAKLHVLGTLMLRNNGPQAASTLLVRDCSYDSTPGPGYPGEESCTSPSPTPVAGPTGLVEVADTGELDVQGGGVNLGDQFEVVVRGLLRVRAGAYVAADHGTRLEVQPRLTSSGVGVLRFEGDGGFLEGKTAEDTGIDSLSVLLNRGRIEKTSGTGRALVSAAYAQPDPGRVVVQRGALLLPSGAATPARVGGGVTFGTGHCDVPLSPTCPATTDATFPQSAQMRIPTADTSGAGVVVRTLSSKSATADLGLPFEVHASGLRATRRHPAIIELRFDATVLDGKTWRKVRILRKPGTSPYRVVKACKGNGRPPSGEVTCVDRRRRPGSSRNVPNLVGAPDVIMVIRAVKTSRWIGR